MKSCQFYQKQLILYHYNELEANERTELEVHLSACATCQHEYNRLETISNQTVFQRPDHAVLQSTRRALFTKIRNRASDRNALKTQWKAGKLVLQTGLAVVLVLFGFLLGRQNTPSDFRQPITFEQLITNTQPISIENTQVSPFMAGIDRINVNRESGTIEVSYNTINEIRLQSKPEDPEVQDMIRYALLHGETVAVRLRAAKAMHMIAMETHQLSAPLLSALEQQLYRETNLGVKLTLIKNCAVLPKTPKVQDILVNVMLYDSEESMRIQAFKALTDDSHPSAHVESFLVKMKSDSNAYIRTKSTEILNTISQPQLTGKERTL